MSFPTPKGSFALPIVQLRTMVSLSKEFQAETNTDTATDALKHISFTRNDEDKIARPFACIMLGDSHNYQQDSGGDANFLIPDGNVGLYLTKDTNPLYKFDLDAAVIDAANFFGTVIDDVVAISGKDNPHSDVSHLPINSGHLDQFSDSSDEDTDGIGEFFYAVYLLNWGVGI